MISVNKFLCCLKLELGGLLLGYVNILLSIIVIYFIIFNFGDQVLHLVLSLCVAVTYGFISFFLVQGTKRRNHVMTQPFRILCYLGFIAITFEIIFLIIQLNSKNDQSIFFHHVLFAVLGLGLEFYVLLVVDALHKRFRDEKFHRGGFIIAR